MTITYHSLEQSSPQILTYRSPNYETYTKKKEKNSQLPNVENTYLQFTNTHLSEKPRKWFTTIEHSKFKTQSLVFARKNGMELFYSVLNS